MLLVLPYEFGALFRRPSAYDAARYAIDTISVIGLTGYAFARPLGPQRFWRVFAPIFILFNAAIALRGLPRMLEWSALPRESWLGIAMALAVMLGMQLAISGFMALALFRHGGWLRGPETETVDFLTAFD
ncbi:hypothetical protein [Novosphingobium sp. PhB165]|uniref:hypothetical protein n=1 Tax=Novosphingobium sp. PhB165 TaxID=2485105 RepID=UPI0010533214|nr:hypothetical protein [Novosphingobium sp. PhB165]